MGIANWFVDGFGAAVTDIRQKLVEEGWFGRAVTPPAVPEEEPTLDQALGWAATPPEQPSKPDDRAHGMEIER